MFRRFRVTFNYITGDPVEVETLAATELDVEITVRRAMMNKLGTVSFYLYGKWIVREHITDYFIEDITPEVDPEPVPE